MYQQHDYGPVLSTQRICARVNDNCILDDKERNFSSRGAPTMGDCQPRMEVSYADWIVFQLDKVMMTMYAVFIILTYEIFLIIFV